jgi:hypothetical protein
MMLSIKMKNVSFSIMTLEIKTHSITTFDAKCNMSFILSVALKPIMLIVVILRVGILRIVIL